MSFWKKLFGVEESPKADVAERQATEPSAPANPPPIPSPPIPAAPPEPTVAQSGSAAVGDPSGSFHDAVKGGDLEKVKALLKGNPELVFSSTEGFGWTPLHMAALYGYKDVAELLLANKAEVNAKDKGGETPLHMAAMNGQKDVAELLLANKAEVNAKDRGGATPLHFAAANNHKDVAELLREQGGQE
jgi:ankyrin repeat protein